MTPHLIHDRALGGLVHLGDEIVVPLGGNLQAFDAVQTADDDFAGFSRGFDGDVE